MATSSYLRTLLRYVRPHWHQAVLGIVALFAVNGLGVYIPLLIRDSIDKLQTTLSVAEGTMQSFLPSVLLILGLTSLMWVIRVLSRLWLFGVGRQVEFDLKQRIFEHLLGLEPAYFATTGSGDLISRATSDVDNIRRLVGFAVLSIANTVFAYALTLPVMLSIAPGLSLLALATYPLMSLMVKLFSARLRSQQAEVQEQLAALSELIQEDTSGIAVIKIYAQEENERRAFEVSNERLYEATLDLIRTRTRLFPLLTGLASIGLLVLLVLGSQSLARGTITVGDLVALILYVERLVFPTALLGFTLSIYQQGEVSIQRLEAVLSVEPKIQDSSAAVVLSGLVSAPLRAVNLCYAYPDTAKPALDRVSFDIAPGEMVAIAGPIGSGKSTLANAIPRLLDIAPGQLFLGDRDITQIRLEDLRRQIAYVPQDSFLFSSTVRDNIRYGAPEASQKSIEEAARLAQIHGEILNFPQQYDTLVGERGITLSGGQRQRMSLARALLVEAPILILDDALSSVDNQTATEILQNLANSRAGRTVLFISHQMSAAATLDRTLVLDKGRVVQCGTHAELMAQPGLYRELCEQQTLAARLA